jgi:hypothetical protein
MKPASRLLVAIGLIAATLGLGAAIAAANLPLLGRDFILFWTSARAVQEGVSPYDMDFQARTQQANGWDVTRELMPFNPYSYPPWLAILMWPLARLPYATAFDVWLALGLVAPALAVVALLKAVARSITPFKLLVGLLIVFTFTPVLNGLSVGQLNAALFAILAGMIWGLDTRRDALAGVCMGLLSIKPHVGLIIAVVVSAGLIAQRRLRPLAWATATLAICIGVSFLVSPTWPGDLLASFGRFTALTGFTFPLNGFQDNPTAYAALRVSAESNPIVFGLIAMSLAGLAVVGLRSARRGEAVSLHWLSAAGCVAVFLFTPYTRAYDLTFLLWPLFYFVFSDEMIVATRWRVGLGLLIYFMPIVLLLLGGQGVTNFVSVYVLALALLLPRRVAVVGHG